MREEIKQLIHLQELDQTIRRLQTTGDKLAKDAAEVARNSQTEKQNLEDRGLEAKSFRRALDRREMDLKEREAKISKLQGQLNQVKTNKEYAAFQHEILGLKADASKTEDEILKMLEQAETHQRELKELTRRAEEAVQATAKQRQAFETAISDATARIERVRQERAALAGKIPPNFLGPYERLLHKADGRAMAACRNYVCDGCKMSLTANTVNLLMGGDKLIFCHSCGRILYLAENEDLTGVAEAGRKEQW